MIRENLNWIGFGIKKNFQIEKQYFRSQLNYDRSILNNSNIQLTSLSAQIDYNLTQSFLAGLSGEVINYSNLNLENESALGFNLKYLVR